MTFFERKQEQRKQERRKHYEDIACEVFQIKEYNSLLWFTYNGSLFAPCTSCGCKTGEDAVAMVNVIRQQYVERNMK